MSQGRVTIYSTPGCGWAIRNYAALIEKKIPFTIVMAKDQSGRKTDEFLAVSPYATSPAMTVDDEAVWDSLHMNLYLDERFPRTSLMPETPVDRAQARLWMMHCDRTLFPPITGYRAPMSQATMDRLAEGLLQVEERGLKKRDPGELWMGSQISLIDMCYSTFFDSLVVVLATSEGHAFELPERLSLWANAIDRHPAIQKAKVLMDSLSLDRPSIDVSPQDGVTDVVAC